MPRKTFKRKYKKRTTRKRPFSRRKTFNRAIKLSSKEKEAIGSITNAFFNPLWYYNSANGNYAQNTAVENIAVGSQRWNRLGNKITPLGLKLTVDIRKSIVTFDPSIGTNAEVRNSNALTTTFKMVVFQYRNHSPTTVTYQDLKQDQTIAGVSYTENRTVTGRSNNPFDRKKYKIIFEKNMKLSSWFQVEGTQNIPIGSGFGPNRITKSFYIPGKKMLPIEYSRDTPVTTSGGIAVIFISQLDATAFTVDYLPDVQSAVDMTLYYLP